jgi:hypothetical protein
MRSGPVQVLKLCHQPHRQIRDRRVGASPTGERERELLGLGSQGYRTSVAFVVETALHV